MSSIQIADTLEASSTVETPAAVPTIPKPTLTPVELRRQRGLAIAALCKIVQKNGQWIVPSQTGNGHYRVNLNPTPMVPQCNCADYAERNQPCKHVFAVQFAISREKEPDRTVTTTRTITVKETTAQRSTYRQNWPAYNRAQTTEKHRFQVLLADLCRGVQEPPVKPGKGQRPLSLADMVFAAAFKIYSTVSGRRFSCDLLDAQRRGYIAKAPHFNSVLNYLRLPELTPILRSLIVESARPLKSIESDFAVDSSGFSTSRFVRWIDHKYGQPKQEYDWVKCSLMTGVKTNIVTAVEIDERCAGDCPRFAPLVKTTVAAGFKPREVSADAAYNSYENADLVGSIGATPFIAYRANANPDPKRPGLYETMFHYYNLRRDEFLSHYHKRSNVETTFSMIKAKFGDHLRSKSDDAMANESLCKVLCHNICRLIHSHHELGIVPQFWGKDEIEANDGESEESAGSGKSSASDIDEMMLMFAWI